MAGAKTKMKEYLLQHIGEDVSRETLREVAGNIQDWQRSLRQLRQETGLDIVATQTGYILTSAEPVRDPQIRRAIDNRLKCFCNTVLDTVNLADLDAVNYKYSIHYYCHFCVPP